MQASKFGQPGGTYGSHLGQAERWDSVDDLQERSHAAQNACGEHLEVVAPYRTVPYRRSFLKVEDEASSKSNARGSRRAAAIAAALLSSGRTNSGAAVARLAIYAVFSSIVAMHFYNYVYRYGSLKPFG